MLIKKIKNNSILIQLIVFLIVLYCFTISFGTVFRTEGDMTLKPIINLNFLPYAIMVFSLLCVLFVGKLQTHRIVLLLFSLTLYLLINSFLFSDDIIKNLNRWVSFLGNVLLVYLISNLKFKTSFLNVLFVTLSIGGFIASLFTLVDYFNVINIPYFNEFSIGVIGFEARGGSGPFISRTSMGAFYSIVMPVTLLSFISFKRPFFLISFIMSFTAMISTFNRGAPIALIIVALTYLIRKRLLNFKLLLSALVFIIIFVTILFLTFSDEQQEAIRYLALSTLNITDKEEVLVESDNFRTDALKQIFTEIIDNPFGYGFNDFYLKGSQESISVHSNFNFLIYSTGLFGFIWLLFFFRRLYKFTRMISIKELVIIKYSLFSWALYSSTHMVISTFLAWLFLGFLLNRYLNSNINSTLTKL